MIVIKENGRIYIAQSTFIDAPDGQKDAYTMVENMPICRVPGSKTLIAAEGERAKPDMDRIRYKRITFPATLTVPGLHKVLPKIEAAVDELDGLEEGRLQTDLVFAKGDRAFFLHGGTAFKEVESLETIGWREVEFRYAMLLNGDRPILERIIAAYETVGRYAGINLFPVIVWDTATLKPIVVEEETK